jgi:hypothetical protein
MSYRKLHRQAALLALALATPVLAQEASTAPVWSAKQEKAGQKSTASLVAGAYTVPSISDDAVAARFRNAASVYARPGAWPMAQVLVYDHFSRCGLAGSVDVETSAPASLRWVRFAGTRRDATAPTIAEDGLIAATRFVSAKGIEDGADCPAIVQGLYADAAQDRRGVAKLAEHARYVLSGGAIGSSDAPLSGAALQTTLAGRVYAGAFLKQAKLVGVGGDTDHILIMLGEPAGRSRFLAQYLVQPDGRWRFEGATAIGTALAAQLDNQGETK